MAYTIIRPGGLKSEPATGKGALTEDTSVCGSITREDVANLVIKALLSNKTDNKVMLHCQGLHMLITTCGYELMMGLGEAGMDCSHEHLSAYSPTMLLFCCFMQCVQVLSAVDRNAVFGDKEFAEASL